MHFDQEKIDIERAALDIEQSALDVKRASLDAEQAKLDVLQNALSSKDRLNKVLGYGKHQTSNKYVCFLPFHGEFGWYIRTFVKRVQGYNHSNKIVCTKKGHECLFPSSSKFYYDWKDITDDIKAGIINNKEEENIKDKIREFFATDDICFLSASETSWEEKTSLADNIFIPKSVHNLGLKVDIVIAPRNRVVDAHRNWTKENWQLVVNGLVEKNITVGVCGTAATSFELDNISCKSYDHIDVDSDVEMMNNAKLVITQESGLQYLSFLCQRPTFCIDHYLKDFGSDLHRNLEVPFKEANHVWHNPHLLINEIISFLNSQ